MFKRPKVGLALGGGGARGLAHIGVLKILERENIKIDIITGTSAGSIVGAMYAQNPSILEVENKLREFLSSKEYKKMNIDHAIKKPATENLFAQVAENIKERIVINIACSRMSLVTNKRLQASLNTLIEAGNIDDTKIKFGAVASDLVSGKGYSFVTGDIIQAVLASSSIPGFLPPLEINDSKLLDGVVTNPIPIRLAYKLGANIVIAVNVSPDLQIQNDFNNIIDIIMRNNSMMGDAYNNILLEQADVVIRPEVGNYHWAEFNNINDIIQRGVAATENIIPTLRKMVKRRIFHFQKKSSALPS